MSRACPDCQLWIVKDDDNYCSFCRHKFFSLNVTLSSTRFLHEDLPPPAILAIENTSPQAEVTIEQITADQPWVSLDTGDASFPLVLRPLQRKTVEVTVETLDAEDEYAHANIEVRSTAGSETVALDVLPAPNLEVETGEYELVLDDRNLEVTSATVRLKSGLVTIHRIIAEPSDWVRIELPPELTFPIEMDARDVNHFELKLTMDESKLRRLSQTFPAVHEGTVRVVCDGFERSEPFHAKCWKPPELSIWEAGHQFEVLLDRPSQVSLTLQNKDSRDPLGGKGNTALLVHSLAWQTLDGKQVPWIDPCTDVSYPIRIEGGAFDRLSFVINTKGQGAVPEGRHRLRCTLQTNSIRGEETVRCDVKARPAAVYDGVLAIDFGTSNTCCAMLHREANDHEMVSLDVHNSVKPTTAPTVLFYLSADAEDSRKLHIGSYADQVPAEARIVQSTVRSPKRHLGKVKGEHPFEVRYFETQDYGTLSAQDTVTDFLLHVKQAAEEKGKAVFRKCIVTHPARFRTRQLNDLKSAVHRAFGDDCEVITLQEPVASALDFIVSSRGTERSAYSLGVFDFGGGTTDLSLLSVNNMRLDGLLGIEVHVVASTGKWFGGENLTNFILECAVAKARLALPQMQVAQPAELLSDEHSLSDQTLVLMARTNKLRLWQWAETIKPLLFEKGDNLNADDLPFRIDVIPELKLQVFTPPGTLEVPFHFDILKPNAEDVQRYLRDEVVVLSRMLKDLLTRTGVERLDCLLMSGKSSAIPLVETVLREEFPDSDLIRATEPKECVVRGACILDKISHAGEIALNIIGGTTTISRLGLGGNVDGQNVFREWIPAGVPIPSEGLAITRAHFFRSQPIEVLENDSDEDWRSRMKMLNPNIEVQGVYELSDAPDWLSKGVAKPGRLELKITPEYEVSLVGRIDGYAEPLLYRRRNGVPMIEEADEAESAAGQGGR